MARSKHTSDSVRRSSSAKELEDDEEPTHNLWVGNLSLDTVDSDLMELFAKYGALDSVTTYASRNYAFVYFQHVDDAKAAKDSLQGALVRGNAIKIQFTRPAKPGKHVWIGGISSSVTRGQLEDEFSKFGKIEDLKFIGDRNTALIDYYKIDAAIAAVKNMNEKNLGGEQIRVDYVRSQPLTLRKWPEHGDSRDSQLRNKRGMGPPEPLWMAPDAMTSYPESSNGHRRPLTHGGRREGQPSKVLWVGHPPSLKVDEQMLHNSMILFGEIERIKMFPSRCYAFVEFRSIDEARRAKEGLQDRLFNDPRIQILFSNSEVTPRKDTALLPGLRGPRSDIFCNEPPFRTMDFGHSHLMAANNFLGHLPRNTLSGSNIMRPSGPEGFDMIYGGSDSFDDVTMRKFPDSILNSTMALDWRRLSTPPPGMLHSVEGSHPGVRPLPGLWDGLDTRTTKRSRIDRLIPADDAPFHVGMDSQSLRSPVGFQHDRDSLGRSYHMPIGGSGPSACLSGHGEQRGSPGSDHCWRGVIAKGGTPICRALCIPIGHGIDSPFPVTINCSARTGLDLLTKHYAEASGFDIVFFLPDSEEDFASYTEFLLYLGGKNRAGVVKFDDGTTLFLVPPSYFLTKVLNVDGPERLYGVVLKLPQLSAGGAMQQPHQALPSPTSQYIDRRQLPPFQSNYTVASQNEEQAVKVHYGMALPEDLMPCTGGGRSLAEHADELRIGQSASVNSVSNPPSTSQVEVSLTPDLIASLASLIPNKIQSSATGPLQLPLNDSARPLLPPLVPDKSLPPQSWNHEHQVHAAGAHHQEQINHSSQQLQHPFNYQMPVLSQIPTYTKITDGTDRSILSSAQVDDPYPNVHQAASGTTKQAENYVQGGQFSAPPSNQEYQLDASLDSHKNYGMAQTTDGAGVFHQPALQLPNHPASAALHQSEPVGQNQVTAATDKMSAEFSTQIRQLQNALAGSGQGTSQGEADKNQRYQSTLQFATSLLQQIQQQQQVGSQVVQSSQH